MERDLDVASATFAEVDVGDVGTQCSDAAGDGAERARAIRHHNDDHEVAALHVVGHPHIVAEIDAPCSWRAGPPSVPVSVGRVAEVHRDSFPAGQYFVAVAGLAAMRQILSRPSEGRPRMDDIRRIVGEFEEFPNNLTVDVVEHDVSGGYAAWAPSYDGPNPAIEAEEPVVREMLRALPLGRALDAGCGTGRHAGFLAGLGHETIGVDATPGMLAVARERFPDVELREGHLEALPLDDASVDLVVSSLAVCHAPDLDAVLSELARVVRPGGTVIISDPHPMTVQLGGVAGFRDRASAAERTDGFTLPFVPNLLHPLHTYVNAAVAAGLEIVECREPTFPESAIVTNPAYAMVPDAVREAYTGLPFIVVWRLRKPSGP